MLNQLIDFFFECFEVFSVLVKFFFFLGEVGVILLLESTKTCSSITNARVHPLKIILHSVYQHRLLPSLGTGYYSLSAVNTLSAV